MPIIAILLFKIALLALFAFATLFLMARYRKIMLALSPYLAGFSIIVGFSLYSYGAVASGTDLLNAPLEAIRGIIYTARIFLLEMDHDVLTAIPGMQDLSAALWLRTIYWLSQISALIVVQVAIISLFGWKLVDHLRLRFGFHREVYFIQGSDKKALILGEHIAVNDNPGNGADPKRLIVFLIQEDDDEKEIYEQVSQFGGIVKILGGKNDMPYYLALGGMGRSAVRDRKYHIMLMIHDSNLGEDAKRIMSFAQEKEVREDLLDIYAFAESSWDMRKIEAVTQAQAEGKRKYPYTIHIINEAETASRQMIEKRPPYKALSFTGGFADHDFTALILGFGSYGQAALLRLVMNGQFMGSNMRAFIVDKDIEKLIGGFLHRFPALNLSCAVISEQADVGSERFFAFLKEAGRIDYAVLALNDDEANKRTALDLLTYYERQDSGAIPFIAVSETGIAPNELEDNQNRMFVFGSAAEIYRHGVIIRQKADRLARAVNDVYGGPSWYDLDIFTQESNRASADFIPAMLELSGVGEHEAKSREALVSEEDPLTDILARTEHLRWNAFHVAMGYRPISLAEMRERFETYQGEESAKKRLDYARKDGASRLQVCLVPWEELDSVTADYRELERLSGKEPERDFKKNDSDIIVNIPAFLRKADGK